MDFQHDWAVAKSYNGAGGIAATAPALNWVHQSSDYTNLDVYKKYTFSNLDALNRETESLKLHWLRLELDAPDVCLRSCAGSSK